MSKRIKKIELTLGQAEHIYKMCEWGYEQHCKFLRHDNWDDELTAKERYESMFPDRQFLKAIRLMKRKLGIKTKTYDKSDWY